MPWAGWCDLKKGRLGWRPIPGGIMSHQGLPHLGVDHHGDLRDTGLTPSGASGNERTEPLAAGDPHSRRHGPDNNNHQHGRMVISKKSTWVLLRTHVWKITPYQYHYYSDWFS